MGVLNLTPDSFRPESRTLDPAEALRRVEKMLENGAGIIDVGAVSTRPGAAEVDEAEEWRRLEPLLRILPEGTPLSIDTVRSSIVRKVFDLAGPFTVNDISAGEADPAMLSTVGELGLKYVAMHMCGTPVSMDSLTDYPDGVTAEVERYFRLFAERAEKAGITDWILDPGFGFAKTTEQNLELLENLRVFRSFGRPVLAGVADKRFTKGDTERIHMTALENGADILRVHDVEAAANTITAWRSLSR